MGLNVELLRGSFELVIERQPQLTHRFYEILFQRYPQSGALFHPDRRDNQAKMLSQALVLVLDHLEDAPWLTTTLTGLGEKHIEYGVTKEMYGWVGECLLAAIAEAAGNDWSPSLQEAWTDAYGAIAGLMQQGAAKSASSAN